MKWMRKQKKGKMSHALLRRRRLRLIAETGLISMLFTFASLESSIASESLQSDTVFNLTKVQATSLLVAYFRELETQRSSQGSDTTLSPLIQDPYASILLEKLGMDENVIEWKKSPFLNPGVDVLAIRTRIIDDWLAEGKKKQIVNLGAGMCTRPYRLSWMSDTEAMILFEVEKDGALLQTKRQVLIDHKPKARIIDVAADVSIELHKALTLAQLNTTTPTDWIAEGLLAYLPIASHQKIFLELYSLSAPGSRLMITNVEPEFKDWTDKHNVSFPHIGLRKTESMIAVLRNAGWSKNVTVLDDDVFFKRFNRKMNVPVCMIAAEKDEENRVVPDL